MAFFECTIGGGGVGSTLTVTCYSGFAGLTIFITNGVDTYSDVCPSTSPYEVVFEGLANGTWTLSTVYNGTTYTEIVEINLVTQFYPIPDGETATPTDDIQTWLHCAGIFDKNYTSIAQVLSDASTLQALIASNNAADYMARSTIWASSVCADANAMAYIGANDYCASALLSDNTWLNAICNSTYFESVLNVKVPTMTSNTTPSGVAFGSSYNTNNEYYKAFASAGAWLSAIDATNNYVGYQFTEPMVLKKVVASFGVYLIPSCVFTIQGSNDGSTWDNLGTIASDAGASSTKSVIVNNDMAYSRLRIFCAHKIYSNTDPTWAGNCALSRLQFYGRE